MGTHGTNKQNPHGDLPVNETHSHVKLSNTRGTVAVAHWCAVPAEPALDDGAIAVVHADDQHPRWRAVAHTGPFAFRPLTPSHPVRPPARDVPDCGNTEFFINLQTNAHLDAAYGGYCVFAEAEGEQSFAVIDAIAAAVKAQGKVAVNSVTLI
jgi:hypothetical protein